MYSSNMRMDIDSWIGEKRAQSDLAMSYSSGWQPPSIGDVRQMDVSQPSCSDQMYSDGQPPSVNDVRRPEPSQSEPSCTRYDYESSDAHEVLQQPRIPELSLELRLDNAGYLVNSPAAGTHCAYFPGYNEQKANEENVTIEVGQEPMEIDTRLTSMPDHVFSNTDVTILEGHTSHVRVCAWSPAGSLLASGSRDSTARIWTIGDGSNSRKDPLNVAILKHFDIRPTNDNRQNVTALAWNRKGTLLASGCVDGQARIWSKDGELTSTFIKHKALISCLKWNKRGDYLLSGSWDSNSIVWDIKTMQWKQQFEFHARQVLDVDWCNDVSFATCSADSRIYVCKVGDNQPVKTFVGHQDGVNAIKWDPTGTLLASCSYDSTAKIWSIKQDTCVHDLKDHRNTIYTVRWSPTGPGTNNPNQPLVLATASRDSTVKLWDAERGMLFHSLVAHEDLVCTVAFSPNGEYLASGSKDKCMHIWSVKEAKVVKTYVGSGEIFEVCWNKEGDKISACFANNVVCVLDFRM